MDPQLLAHTAQERWAIEDDLGSPDPQLLAHTAETAQDRWAIEDDPGSPDGETSKKRRKLNVWKCKQCREARKKVSIACF